MSARSRPVDLSPEARADYTSILRYTQRRWGARQRDVYSGILDQALGTICNNPDIGRARDDLRPGLRSFHVKQHVIFY
jgi:toxin ParE1/3/4